MNPSLYSGQTVTASVYLRVASGRQEINLYLINIGTSGGGPIASIPVTLTTDWQRFSLTGTNQNGLQLLALQIGGGGSIIAGQSFQVWGAQMQLGSAIGPYVATNELPVVSGQELTNILPNSTIGSQSASELTWTLNNASPAVAAATAPDGTPTATTVTANNGSTDSYVLDGVPNPSLYDGETVTASVYLRVASGMLNTTLYLVNTGVNGWSIVNSHPFTLTQAWQRFSVTGTTQNGLVQLSMQVGGGQTIQSGQSFQIWGAQMAVGDSPAPYTPTPSGTTNVATGQPATLVLNGLNESYSYDSFGNILQKGSFTASYTANNQLVNGLYDAAGNLLSNYLSPMTWDAESRLVSVAGATYLYDADGNRVEKQGVGVTDTVYFGGRPVARLSAGQWTDLIYGPNGMLAEVGGTENADPAYRLLDHLGTEVGTVDSTGILTNPLDYTPFGQVFSGSTNDPYLFTGKERDAESGLDYFEARYYASSMGRFMSPDWDSNPDPIPYADFGNPQSLNLYGYVSNNPLSRSDRNGHQTSPDPCVGNPICVTVTADTDPLIDLVSLPEHHYFPQSLFRNASQYARQMFSNWTSSGLKNLGLHKGYSGPHREYNRKVKEIIQKVSEKYGKPISEWGEEEVHEAASEIRAEAGKTGSEINTLIDDLEKNNPGATQTIKDLGAALEEFETSPNVQELERDAIMTF
jgi:RHS repeat-associated protein